MRAALAGELRVAHPLVVGVLAQRGEVVGLPVLHVGGVDQQRHEQQHAGDGEVADGLVHADPHHLGGVGVVVLVGLDQLRRWAAGVVGDAEQQRDDHPVGDQAGAALGQERRGQTGQRDQPGDAADDHEDLQGEDDREAGGHQLAEVVAADQGGAQAALHEDAVEQDDRHHAGQPELLAQRGQDEVGPGERGDLRLALAEPAADEPAPAHAVEALDELVGVGRPGRTGPARPRTRDCTWLRAR